MAERDCEGCGDLTQIKYLGKIRGKYLCKKCRTIIRECHREETVNNTSEEEREKIRELSRKVNREYEKIRRKKTRKQNIDKEPPIIKGSKLARKKPKSNSYLSLEDKRYLLRTLMNKGLDFEEAKERIDNIIQEQSRVRAIMKEDNKSEEQIMEKQKQMLEELWNY